MSTSLVLEQLAVGIALQLLGLLVAMWLFRWRKQAESPEKLLEKLEGQLEKRMIAMEELARDRESNLWDVIDALREQNSGIRGDIMWIKAKINGTGWKSNI